MNKSTLLVLDLNRLLVERKHSSKYKGDHGYQFITPNGYCVFVRPYTKEFLRYAFHSFNVGIWSCMNYRNTHTIVKRILTKKQQNQLQFVMSQEDCYSTGEYKMDGSPTFYKSLNKLWKKPKLHRFYNRTLLIDDSENKIKYNPDYTSIHPTSFNHNYKNDKELKALQKYLSELHSNQSEPFFAVPSFVKRKPYNNNHKSSTRKIPPKNATATNERESNANDWVDDGSLQPNSPLFVYRQTKEADDIDRMQHSRIHFRKNRSTTTNSCRYTIKVCRNIIKVLMIIASVNFLVDVCSSFII